MQLMGLLAVNVPSYRFRELCYLLLKVAALLWAFGADTFWRESEGQERGGGVSSKDYGC